MYFKMRHLVIYLALAIGGCINQSSASVNQAEIKEKTQKEVKKYETSSQLLDIVEPKKIGETDKIIIFEVSSSYILGDGDNRVDAKNMALQQAKILASEQAGTYVRSEVVIENDKIEKEQITTLTTALMSITVKNEKYSITSEGRTKLTLTVVTKLDKKQFIDKIKSLHGDDSKQKQISALQKQNKKLVDELNFLNLKISTIKKTDETVSTIPNKQLFEKRNKLLSKIDKNEKNIKRVFLEKGSLFKLALQEDNDFEKAKEDILNNFFEVVKDSIEYSVGEPFDLRSNDNGTYDFNIEVSYKIIRFHQVRRVLKKYFIRACLGSDERAFCHVDDSSLIHKYKGLEKWLSLQIKNSKNIYLSITLGNSQYNSFVNVISAQSGSSINSYKLRRQRSNTVRFKNIPIEFVESLASINVEIIESDKGDLK